MDDYSIVVKPSKSSFQSQRAQYEKHTALPHHHITLLALGSGSSVWIDGGDNLSIGGTCTGFFVMADDLCQEFINDDLSTMSSSSELSETIVPLTMSPSLAPTSFSQGICDFEEDDLPCIEVGNFTDIQVAIEASSDVVFCGGFNILKPTDDVIELSDIHNIRCILTCTISGEGTHVEVSGSDSQVRMDNMKFMLSDSSAVRITTSSANATTTFCRTEFWRNKAHFGGAIFVSRKSGFVNVMSSSFTNNEAFKGGAIFGGAKQLKIIDSVFVNNIATKGVS